MAPTGQPFARTPGFVVLSVVLLAGAGWLGVQAGGGLDGGGGGGGGAVSDAPSDAPTGASVEFITTLPASVYRDCTALAPGDGQDAAVRCASVVPGPRQLEVRQFVDAETMQDAFAARYASTYDDGKCGTFPGGADARGTGRRSTWGARNARLACYVDDDGQAVLLWQYRDQAVQVVATRDDADSASLFAWWERTTRTPLT